MSHPSLSASSATITASRLSARLLRASATPLTIPSEVTPTTSAEGVMAVGSPPIFRSPRMRVGNAPFLHRETSAFRRLWDLLPTYRTHLTLSADPRKAVCPCARTRGVHPVG